MPELLSKDDLRGLITSAYEKLLWALFCNYDDVQTECVYYDRTPEEQFDTSIGELKLSLPVVENIIERYLKDQEKTEEFHEKIDGIDNYKKAGYLSFWIVKLRPIMILTDTPTKEEMLINELLAISITCALLYDKHSKIPPFNDSILENLKYTLRYRINTRHQAALIYESLCNF